MNALTAVLRLSPPLAPGAVAVQDLHAFGALVGALPSLMPVPPALPPVLFQASIESAVDIVATLDRSATLSPQPVAPAGRGDAPVPSRTNTPGITTRGSASWPEPADVIRSNRTADTLHVVAPVMSRSRTSAGVRNAENKPAPGSSPGRQNRPAAVDDTSAHNPTEGVPPIDSSTIPMLVPAIAGLAIEVSTGTLTGESRCGGADRTIEGNIVAQGPSAPQSAPQSGPAIAVQTPVSAEHRLPVAAKLQAPDESKASPSQPVPDATNPATVIAPGLPTPREASPVASTIAAPVMQPELAMVQRHLDLARGDAWLADLARDIAGAAVRGGHLKFALAPETLGRLDVEVRTSDAGVSIHMAARSEAARDALAVAQPRLIDEIHAQGVRVTYAEIAADSFSFGGERSGGGARQAFAPPVDLAPVASNPAQSEPHKTVADGRYA